MKQETKRVQVSLRLPMYELIDRMSFLTKQPRSKVIAGLLEPCYMPLTRTVALLDAARDAPEEIKHGLVRAIEDLESDIEALIGVTERETEHQFDLLEKAVKSEKVNPPSSNRGVGHE